MAAKAGLRFRDELGDFLRFVRRPGVLPRLPGRPAGNGWWLDWFPPIRLGRLVQWALLLWAINLLFLGPIAVAAAGAGGAQHRLDLNNIPFLHALVWAPIVEELVFRYGLRNVGKALWMLPLTVAALLTGPSGMGIALLAAALFFCWRPYLRNPPSAIKALPWPWRKQYLRAFPWVVHISCIAFAAVHLNNFSLNQTSYWLMPLLVLPQWLTGLVLGWLRVRRGIGASILLHGIFNGGPLLLVWIVLQSGVEVAV